jgi:hypothetical protein
MKKAKAPFAVFKSWNSKSNVTTTLQDTHPYYVNIN